MINTDIIIVGAGIAGRSAAWLASKQGFSVCVIEHEGCEGYASARNQGWLHSGAHYVQEDRQKGSDLYDLCFSGSQDFFSFNEEYSAGAISEQNALYTYTGVTLRESDFALIRRLQCDAELVNRDVISSLATVGTDRHNFIGGIQTRDRAIDTIKIMERLATLSSDAGCMVLNVSSSDFSDLTIRRDNQQWCVWAGEYELISERVVVAAGSLIPRIAVTLVEYLENREVSSSAKAAVMNATYSRCTVVAIKGNSSSVPLITYDDHGSGLNYIPCAGGATLNIRGQDRTCSTPGPAGPPQHFKMEDELWEQIAVTLPGLDRPGHLNTAYGCTKLNIGDRRKAFVEELSPGLHLFYPGKFTLALNGAARLLGSMTVRKKYGLAKHSNSHRTFFPSFKHPIKHIAARDAPTAAVTDHF